MNRAPPLEAAPASSIRDQGCFQVDFVSFILSPIICMNTLKKCKSCNDTTCTTFFWERFNIFIDPTHLRSDNTCYISILVISYIFPAYDSKKMATSGATARNIDSVRLFPAPHCFCKMVHGLSQFPKTLAVSAFLPAPHLHHFFAYLWCFLALQHHVHHFVPKRWCMNGRQAAMKKTTETA